MEDLTRRFMEVLLKMPEHYLNHPLRTIQCLLFAPRIYAALSIKDFLDDKDKVKPTRNPLAGGWYGTYIAYFPSSLSFERIDPLTGQLADLACFIEVGLRSMLIQDSKRYAALNKSMRMRLYEPMICYNPLDRSCELMRYNLHGPAASDREPERETLSDLVAATAGI